MDAEYPVQISENVARISPRRIAKSGWLIFLEREAEVTKFVRSSTSIPVPEIYGVEQSADHPEKGELIMEFIPGDPLHIAWPRLTEQQQVSIVSQLRSYIEEMRTLPQPHPGWIESCCGGPAMDHRVGDGFPFGPISSERDFNELLTSRIKSMYPESYEIWRPKFRDDHAIVFSHADLYEKHIIIDPGTAIVNGIIDWEMAGFWPEYWEYNKSLYGGPPNPIWRDCVKKIMDCYEEERINDWSIHHFIL